MSLIEREIKRNRNQLYPRKDRAFEVKKYYVRRFMMRWMNLRRYSGFAQRLFRRTISWVRYESVRKSLIRENGFRMLQHML